MSGIERIHIIHVSGVDPERDAIVAALSQSPTIEACVHDDQERIGCIANWLTALKCSTRTDPATQGWAVILSDDAGPLEGWENHLRAATRFSPAPFLGLTHFGRYGLQALRRGVPYGVGAALLWGGGAAYRHAHTREMHRWVSALAATGYPHDDWAACAFAIRNGLPTAMTSRAIFSQSVEHSLIGHGGANRTPRATIESHPGPSYFATPRSITVSRSVPSAVEASRFQPSPTSSRPATIGAS